MKLILLSVICLFFLSINTISAKAVDPMPSSPEEIAAWFDDGVSAGATHMVVVDCFYSLFPAYVFAPQNPQEVVNQYTVPNRYWVVGVYALFLDKEMQFNEPHFPWHLETP